MDCNRARTKDPSEWLETCPEFSLPLAVEVNEWFLTWQPDLSTAIKWNMLCYSGRKLIVGLSACRKHLGIVFFRGTELPDPAGLFGSVGLENTNIRNVRLTSLERFPQRALREMLQHAVKLDEDPTIAPIPKVKRAPWPVPDFFNAALKRKENRAAAECFAKLSPSCQREYLVWLTSAKRPETREARLTQTLKALTGGRKWDRRKG